MLTFQELISQLTDFWVKQGCLSQHGHDLEMGAGTFNPATFLRCLGPEPYNSVYVEPSRRPTDGRYGANPNRLQRFHQLQVIMKPSPLNILELFIESLEKIGLNLSDHDLRFVHDDWESPTLGAWGLGWEVWLNGMEITQFTYFQQVGSLPLDVITGEITIGLERLAMYLQNIDNVYDLQWNESLTYGDIFLQDEQEWSTYNFEKSDTAMWHRHFDDYEREAKRLIEMQLPIPAYDFVMKASHAFNMLDAGGVISVTERTVYIGRIRQLSRLIAECYVGSRERLGFPLTKRWPSLEKKEKNLPPPPQDLLEKETEDLLLEIGSEELPATFVPIGLQNLQKALEILFKDLELSYEKIHVYGTPRRLAVLVKGLSTHTKALKIERKGPAISSAFDENGSPTKACQGFFRSLQMEASSLDSIQKGENPQVEIRSVKGTDYLFALIEKPSQSAAEILSQKMEALILGLDFPKKMKWSDLEIAYARPLQWVLALFGKEILPFRLGNLVSGRESYGHRQLSPQSFEISHAKEYIETLRKHHVMVDIEERTEEIKKQLKKIEEEKALQAVQMQKVIPQVLHLIEWPFLCCGNFSEDFLQVPQEIMISEMVEHQKTFPLVDKDGKLKNTFVITANNTPSDTIRKGNEKVISARLADGAFLYEQDKKKSLEDFNEKLKAMTYQKELGTVFDKVLRIEKFVAILHESLPLCPLEKAQRAAHFCKADLASELVGEFPELQGIIGKDYARLQGEDPEVAEAINEHWMPRGEKSPLPQSAVGILVSLADKIDNLISCFRVGQKPTSSSDPHALRRQVLGMIRMLIEGKYFLPLKKIFQECGNGLPEDLIEEILHFIKSRIKTVFLDFGFEKDEIEASLAEGVEDIYDTFCRVRALNDFRKSGLHFSQLHEVYKRAKGQIQKEQQHVFSGDLLEENAEKILAKHLHELEAPFQRTLEEKHYQESYHLIASLQSPLSELFDQVKILADNPEVKNNRIALLQKVFQMFEQLLDFSKIQS